MISQSTTDRRALESRRDEIGRSMVAAFARFDAATYEALRRERLSIERLLRDAESEITRRMLDVRRRPGIGDFSLGPDPQDAA